MTRYIRQKNDFDCAPVAIVNAIRWNGLTTPSLKTIRTKCKTDKEGTYTTLFQKTLREYLPKSSRLQSPSLLSVDSYLNFGRAVILSHSYTRNDGIEESHYTLCIGYESVLKFKPNDYILVNDVNRLDGEIITPTVSVKSRSEFGEMIYSDFEVWLI